MTRLCLSLLFLSRLLPAASELGGVQSGWVFDASAKVLRAVTGSCGAAYLSSPVITDVEMVQVSPDGDQAIVRRSGAMRHVRSLQSSTPTETTLSDALPEADLITWSADSQAFALGSTATRMVQSFRWNQAQFERGLDLNLAVSGRLRAVWPALDGRSVLVAVEDEHQGGFFHFGPHGSEARVLTAVSPFAASGRSSWLAGDAASGALFRLRESAGSIKAELFLPASTSFRPTSAVLAGKSGTVYLVAAGERLIRAFKLDTGESLQEIPIPVEAKAIRSISGNLMLVEAGHGIADASLIVVDTQRGNPVCFVPAGAAQQ